MAGIVLPILVLQSPHRRSTVKEHIACLERCLKLWRAGDLVSLIKEGPFNNDFLSPSKSHLWLLRTAQENGLARESAERVEPRGPPWRVSAYEISKSTGFHMDLRMRGSPGFSVATVLSRFR